MSKCTVFRYFSIASVSTSLPSISKIAVSHGECGTDAWWRDNIVFYDWSTRAWKPIWNVRVWFEIRVNRAELKIGMSQVWFPLRHVKKCQVNFTFYTALVYLQWGIPGGTKMLWTVNGTSCLHSCMTCCILTREMKCFNKEFQYQICKFCSQSVAMAYQARNRHMDLYILTNEQSVKFINTWYTVLQYESESPKDWREIFT